jgi:hypothetical protein
MILLRASSKLLCCLRQYPVCDGAFQTATKTTGHKQAAQYCLLLHHECFTSSGRNILYMPMFCRVLRLCLEQFI